MSFLTAFKSFLHALEVASVVAQPIVALYAPEEAGIMRLATVAAISAEKTLTTPGSGDQKAAMVKDTVTAAVDAANSILASQNKAPLAPTLVSATTDHADVIVAAMNAIASAVETAKPKA